MARRPASLRALAAARGDEPADLLLAGGRVFVPPTGEWLDVPLAVCDGIVVGWGEREALEVHDLAGAAVTPGFIDAHMHLESTKMWVDEFVRSVLAHGTTAVAADPHELANVFGVPGVEALRNAADGLPFTFGICASSCVPASRFESSGATLGPQDVADLLDRLGAIGVAEVMDFPGVISGRADVRAKIAAAGHRRVDGHAPGLGGRALDAYLAAGVESDHECTSFDEALEKRRKGMWVFVREGSASRNLATLLPLTRVGGVRHLAWCTDDREPDLLLGRGHVNDCCRLAVAGGLSVEDALVLATMNAAEYHGFHHLGQLAPGFQADVVVFDDLSSWAPSAVYQRGRLVARNGAVLPATVPAAPAPSWMHRSIHLSRDVAAAALDHGMAPGTRALLIGVRAGTIVTDRVEGVVGGPDVARIAVLERHRGSGRVGLGLVTGFGIARGAIASTVAHDAHNVVALGAPGPDGPDDLAVAVTRLAELGGGQVAVVDGRVVAEVALPIGGLMSDRPADEVAAAIHHLGETASQVLGITLPAPFMQLSFLALSVIPSLRITDRGLVDVDRFELVDVALA